MTEKAVLKQINDEWLQYENEIFDGEVPKGIVQLFINGIMSLSSFSHKILCSQIERIINKTEGELTNTDVAIIVRALVAVPFKELYANLTEALQKHSEFEKLVYVSNENERKKREALERKKQSLLTLAGVNGGNAMQQRSANGQSANGQSVK